MDRAVCISLCRTHLNLHCLEERTSFLPKTLEFLGSLELPRFSLAPPWASLVGPTEHWIIEQSSDKQTKKNHPAVK